MVSQPSLVRSLLYCINILFELWINIKKFPNHFFTWHQSQVEPKTQTLETFLTPDRTWPVMIEKRSRIWPPKDLLLFCLTTWVHAMIVREERHRTIARTKDERGEVVGFSTQTGRKVAAVRAKEKFGTCGHCGRTWHHATECFQFIGYPEWWGDRPRGNGHGQNKGRRGGTVSRGRGNTARMNAARVGSTDDGNRMSSSGDPDTSGFTGLNKE